MELSKGNKTALVFGASGLVGNHLVHFLLMDPAYTEVHVFVRNKLELEHEKLKQTKVNFDNMEHYSSEIVGDDLFLCLGSTMKIAGSKEAFYEVDFEYSFNISKIAVANEVNQVLLVSSVGADANSRIFYSKVKGALEDALRKLPFWSIHIFRPSVLLGERNENRWGEEISGKIGKFLNRITGGLLMKYQPVEADVVAKAMVNAAQQLKPGINIYPSHVLQELSQEINKDLRKV